jgi:hypothetical protein
MKLIQQTNLNDSKIDKLLEIISRYKLNKIIYPGVITRELNINNETTYEVLGIFVKEKILEINYEVYSRCCNKFQGNKIYRSMASIPEDLSCEFCGRDLDKIADTIIVFRVIKDVRE